MTPFYNFSFPLGTFKFTLIFGELLRKFKVTCLVLFKPAEEAALALWLFLN